MTLLQHVKLRPVLPALNEIKMTLIFGSVLILFNAASLSPLTMVPSSSKDTSELHSGIEAKGLHLAYRMPFCDRKGSTRSSMLVNCEKTIVLSSPSLRSSISFNNESIIRIFAESPLVCCFCVRLAQSAQ